MRRANWQRVPAHLCNFEAPGSGRDRNCAISVRILAIPKIIFEVFAFAILQVQKPNLSMEFLDV